MFIKMVGLALALVFMSELAHSQKTECEATFKDCNTTVLMEFAFSGGDDVEADEALMNEKFSTCQATYDNCLSQYGAADTLGQGVTPSNQSVCRPQRNTCRDTAEDQEFNCFTRCNIDFPFGSSACKEDCRVVRQSSNAQCDAQEQSCMNGTPSAASSIGSVDAQVSRPSTNASIEPILGELEELAKSANEAASFSNPSGADGRPCITLQKMPDSYQSSQGREVVRFSNSCPMIMYVEYSANVSSLDEGGMEIQPNSWDGVTCDGVCRISNVRWKIAQWHYE